MIRPDDCRRPASGDRGDGRGVRLDGVCDEVVLQPSDGELTVGERFFDGLLRAVCSSVVSEFSPDPVQTLMEQGFGGAEGIGFWPDSPSSRRVSF